MMILTVLLIVLECGILCQGHESTNVTRPMELDSQGDARFLVYSNGGIFKFIMAWAVPVEVPMSVVYAHNIQFQFPAIDTAEKLYDLLKAGYARQNRNTLYKYIHNFLYRNKMSDCLPKLICQVSEAPLGHNGLLAQLLQVIFTPDAGSTDRFREAWESGKHGADCTALYAGCIYPLLDSVSTVKYI